MKVNTGHKIYEMQLEQCFKRNVCQQMPTEINFAAALMIMKCPERFWTKPVKSFWLFWKKKMNNKSAYWRIQYVYES